MTIVSINGFHLVGQQREGLRLISQMRKGL